MKFALRISILGLVFVALFSVLGLRLWFVQVAEGPAIAQAAEDQTWISKTSHAPRGEIFDRQGRLLATSRLVPAVVVDRTFVQPDDKSDLIQRLSALLSMPPSELEAMYEEAGINGRFEVTTVDNDVAYQVTEQLDELPGVEITKVPERVYLSGPTLAHVIGHLGLPNEADLEEDPDLDPTQRIGKLGVERVYDDFLQGTSGLLEYRVRRGEIIDQRPAVEPIPGNSIQLTLDLELQQLVELALEDGIALSNSQKELDRLEGEEVFNETKRAAAVVLDAKTFEVLSLASVPDFDPQLFVTGIDEAKFAELNEAQAFNNLAVSGVYPPASTFKAITYTVFEEENLPLWDEVEGVDAANEQVECDGELILPNTLSDGSPQVKRDWYYPGNRGTKDIHGALEMSCNIFFWNVGLGTWHFYKDKERETILQDWAKSLSYGSETGVDLANEAEGVVPTRELFEEWAAIQREDPNVRLLDESRLALASPFLGGDLMDFAIGQGAFLATPLQVAVSYAGLVNGGTIMQPRVVDRIIDGSGDVAEKIEPEFVHSVPISDETRTALLRDLNRVVTSGTASSAFKDFGEGLERVGGKTGTGQSSANRDNHAWFVGVAPIDNPRYIVAVVIEEGGSGGGIAAPVARRIMQVLMGNEPTPIDFGQEAD